MRLGEKWRKQECERKSVASSLDGWHLAWSFKSNLTWMTLMWCDVMCSFQCWPGALNLFCVFCFKLPFTLFICTKVLRRRLAREHYAPWPLFTGRNRHNATSSKSNFTWLTWGVAEKVTYCHVTWSRKSFMTWLIWHGQEIWSWHRPIVGGVDNSEKVRRRRRRRRRFVDE